MTDRDALIDDPFWSLVTPTGFCWEWEGKRNTKGHGRHYLDRRTTVAAHRYAYEALVGPIPKGLVLDHLCRNPPCVNPDHAEPVTNRENVLRGYGVTAQQARQTHCKRGHEFTDENTWITKSGMRHCRTCSRERLKNYNKERVECPICGELKSRGNRARHMRLMHA